MVFSKIHQIVQHSILLNEVFKLLGKSHGDQKSGKDNHSQAYLKKKIKNYIVSPLHNKFHFVF